MRVRFPSPALTQTAWSALLFSGQRRSATPRRSTFVPTTCPEGSASIPRAPCPLIHPAPCRAQIRPDTAAERDRVLVRRVHDPSERFVGPEAFSRGRVGRAEPLEHRSGGAQGPLAVRSPRLTSISTSAARPAASPPPPGTTRLGGARARRREPVSPASDATRASRRPSAAEGTRATDRPPRRRASCGTGGGDRVRLVREPWYAIGEQLPLVGHHLLRDRRARARERRLRRYDALTRSPVSFSTGGRSSESISSTLMRIAATTL